MEALYSRLVRAFRHLQALATPYLRRLIRFVALPYCYVRLVNWKECTASRWQVAKDLLYIFFVLKYYPDNYTPCRLWEKPRATWAMYYGSSYDPWQRAQLRRVVQRRDYEVLFEDKEVCLMLCAAVRLPVPRLLGVIDPRSDWRVELSTILASSGDATAIVKPVTGSAGGGVVQVRIRDGLPEIADGPNVATLESYTLSERSIVQEVVKQTAALASFNRSSVNTVRVLTLLTTDSDVITLGASMRFGVGPSCRDNWSAGGVAVGVDAGAGTLLASAYDKRGNRYTHHPTSGVGFEGFQVPQWGAVVSLAHRVQQAFPFYRLLGSDIAIADNGPIIIEINAFPDLVFQEQTSGALLSDPRILNEFGRWGLLINKEQRRLFGEQEDPGALARPRQ